MSPDEALALGCLALLAVILLFAETHRAGNRRYESLEKKLDSLKESVEERNHLRDLNRARSKAREEKEQSRASLPKAKVVQR